MDENAEEEVLHRLNWENRMLKQRVFELEEKLRRAGVPASNKDQESSVMKLLKAKDERLEGYAAEMEQKQAELQKTVEELRERNEQLSLWMSGLRLYQEVFETEAAAMIGVNPEGKIILFNRAAPEVLGEKFRSALHQPIEAVDFRSFDPTTPSIVRSTLRSRQPGSHSVRVRDRQVTTNVFPLGSEKELTGALVKILVVPA